MNNLCRLCLSASENMTELFGDEKINNLVKECTGIEIVLNATLPSCICDPCLLQLYNIEQFIALIKRNQSCLFQLLDYNNIIDEGSFDLEFLTGDVDALQALALTLPNLDKSKNRDDYEIHMEIDVLDSDLQVVSDLLGKNITNPEKPVDNYSCKYCKSIFLDSQHMNSCDCRKNHVYRCKQCKKVFPSRMELYNHAKGHINKLNCKKFKCRLCENSYSSQAELNQHSRSKHTENVLYRCKVCQLIFSDRKNLYSHVKQHTSVLESNADGEGGNGHLCDACGRSFNSHSALNRHVLTHTNDLYQCKHCNKKFASENLLKVHDNVHEAERKMCEVCGIILSNDVSLKLHISSHVS